MPIKSTEQFRQDLITAARAARTGLNLQDYEVLDASYFRPLSGELYKVNLIQEFLRRMMSFSGMRSLVSDTVFIAQLSGAYGVSIPDAQNLVETTIVDFAQSFGVQRTPAKKASGYERFINPTNTPISVGNNKTIATGQNPQKFYVTLSSVDNMTPIFDNERGYYYIELPIECTVAGAVGNVSDGKVTVMVDSDISATFVSNIDPITGGTEQQTVLSLIDNFESVFKGITLNTVAGYENFTRRQNDVIDVYGARETDPLFTREFSAGAIDLWALVNQRDLQAVDVLEWREIVAASTLVSSTTKELSVTSVTNPTPNNYKLVIDVSSGITATQFVRAGILVQLLNFTPPPGLPGLFYTVAEVGEDYVTVIVNGLWAPTTGILSVPVSYVDFPLSKQPVAGILMVKKQDGIPLTVQDFPKYSYELVLDTSSISRSAKGNDSIRMRIDTFDSSDRIQIMYVYNSVIVLLQNLIESVENNVVGSSVLYRKAIPKDFSITVSPVFSNESDRVAVQDTMVSDVFIFFNGGVTSKGIEYSNRGVGGANFQITDLLNLILDIDGIDSLNTLASYSNSRMAIVFTVDSGTVEYSADNTLGGINKSQTPSLEITLANNENFNLRSVLSI